jgi:hypothetical protein
MCRRRRRRRHGDEEEFLIFLAACLSVYPEPEWRLPNRGKYGYHATNLKFSNSKWQKMLKQICRCSQDVSSQFL